MKTKFHFKIPFPKWKAILILLCALSGIQNQALAQGQVPYEIITDDPTIVPTSYIDFVYFDYEGSLSNQNKWHKAVAGLGASLLFEIKPLDRIGVQGRATIFYYGDKREAVKLPFHLEGGGVISLKSKTKQQEIKVPLKYFKTKVDVVDNSGKYLGRADAMGMQYIEPKVTKEFRTWGRAGVMLRRSTYRPFIDRSPQLGSQTVAGLYAGFEITRRAHAVVKVEGKEVVSAEYMKFYGDLMIYPLATHSTAERNRRYPAGFRLGMTGKLPGMKHFLNYMFPKVEVGIYPLDGWYWSVGLGMNIFKA